MAALLEVTPTHVRHMELGEWFITNRRVMPATAKLVKAWLGGYRPHDWPQQTD
jgi:hypothetical protein